MTTPYRCRQLASMVRTGQVVRAEEVATLLDELANIYERKLPPNLESIRGRVEECDRKFTLLTDAEIDRKELFTAVLARK